MQHGGERETVDKLRRLLAKSARVFDDRRLGQRAHSDLARVNFDRVMSCGRFTVYATGRSAAVVCWAKSLISSARDLTSSLR